MTFGILTLALAVGSGGLGAWLWRSRGHGSTLFWRLLRTAQAALVVQAALGGILVLSGHKVSGLHLTYGLVPIAVSFVAEQLRIASAEMVLDQRGFESAADVGRLGHDEQVAVANAILRRELGVMTLAMLVNVVLLVRAAGTGG